MDNEVINVDGTLIHKLQIKPQTFLNKSIILYGPSETGKTVLIKYILSTLQNTVPICMAFVPTDDPDSSSSYSHIINNRCIIRKLETATEKMKNLFIRQNDGRKVTSLVNDVSKLKLLYEKNRIDKIDIMVNNIIKTTNDGKNSVNANFNKTPEQKVEQLEQLEKIKNDKLREVYKKGIEKYKAQMIKDYNEKKISLTEEELKILKFLNYNNNIVVIFDDCMAEINKWGKDEEIKKIFFQGRHYNITTIISMHHDKGFHPDLRSNAFINIFTNAQVANNYFNTKNNGIGKELSKTIPKIIDKIFKQPLDPTMPKNHKKLVFIPRDDNQIQFVIAKNLNNFKFGCSGLNKLTNAIDEIEDQKTNKNKKTAFTV